MRAWIVMAVMAAGMAAAWEPGSEYAAGASARTNSVYDPLTGRLYPWQPNVQVIGSVASNSVAVFTDRSGRYLRARSVADLMQTNGYLTAAQVTNAAQSVAAGATNGMLNASQVTNAAQAVAAGATNGMLSASQVTNAAQAVAAGATNGIPALIVSAFATNREDKIWVSTNTWWQATTSNVISKYVTTDLVEWRLTNATFNLVVTAPYPIPDETYTYDVVGANNDLAYTIEVGSGNDDEVTWTDDSSYTHAIYTFGPITAALLVNDVWLVPIFYTETNRTDYPLVTEYSSLTNGVFISLTNALLPLIEAAQSAGDGASAAVNNHLQDTTPHAGYVVPQTGGAATNLTVVGLSISNGITLAGDTITAWPAGLPAVAWLYSAATTNALGYTSAVVYTNGLGGAVTNFFTDLRVSPKTGQTTSYATGDDGYWQSGRAWPVPRFTIVGAAGTVETNQVRDNLTGLIIAREATFIVGGTNWTAAIHYITNTLNGAAYGGASDWRLPNRREMESLMHYQYESPCLPNTAGTGQWAAGDPFHNVVAGGNYLTSTTRMGSTTLAFCLQLSSAQCVQAAKSANSYFFAVREGSQ